LSNGDSKNGNISGEHFNHCYILMFATFSAGCDIFSTMCRHNPAIFQSGL